MKKSINTILDCLDIHAEGRGTRGAYTFLANGESESERLSFGELRRRAYAIAGLLQEKGAFGKTAILLFQSGLDFIVTFLGCLYAGVIAVPACPPRKPEELCLAEYLVQASGSEIILSHSPVIAGISAFAPGWGRLSSVCAVDTVWRTPDWHSLAEQFVGLNLDPAQVAFLQFTSGSVNNPRGVMVSHANIINNQEVIREGFQHSEETVVMTWLPHYHDMGLVGTILQPLFLGVPCVLMPPTAFIQKPLRWLMAVSRYRATTSGAPNFAYDLCSRMIGEHQLLSLRDLDLSCWNVAFTGAEPIRASTLRVFAERFQSYGFRREAFYPCYGMAEGTLMITGIRRDETCRVATLDADALACGRAVEFDAGTNGHREIVNCGRSRCGNKLVIVDPETHELCNDGVIGEIWVTGPSVTLGYWRDEEATKKAHGARVRCRDGHFLRTGDLGFLKDGQLYVTGRLKTLFIKNGRKFHPEDIEATVACVDTAFRPNTVALAIEDHDAQRLVVVQEVYKHLLKDFDSAAADKAIRRVVSREYGIKVDEVIFTTGRIPKTTSGKTRRAECQQRWREGRLVQLKERSPAGRVEKTADHHER